ncbi:transposase [Runella sp.]
MSIRTGIYFIDSTKIEVCHPKRVHQHKVFKGLADWVGPISMIHATDDV